jgi:hypothetical protein
MNEEEKTKAKRFAQEAILLSERKKILLKNLKIVSYEMTKGNIVKVKAQDIISESIYTCMKNTSGFPSVIECDDTVLRKKFRQKYDNIMERRKTTN